MKLQSKSCDPRASAGMVVLVVLALGLCGLCAWQWWGEAALRQRVEAADAAVADLRREKGELETTVARLGDEVRRLENLAREGEGRVEGLVSDLEAARVEATALKADAAQAEVFRAALSEANEAIRRQNGEMQQLNAAYGKLAEERNEVVGKYNALGREYEKVVLEFNATVEKYNGLVRELEAARPKAR